MPARSLHSIKWKIKTKDKARATGRVGSAFPEGRSVGQPKATHRRQTPCQNFVRFNFKVSNAVRPNETLNEDGISCKSIDRCHRLVEMRKKCLGYCQKPVLMSSLSEQSKGYTSPLDPWIYARKNGKPSAYASLNHSQYTWASSNPRAGAIDNLG